MVRKCFFHLVGKYVLLTILYCTFCKSVTAQVSVNLQLPPPFKFKIEDLWKITLMNSGSPIDIYLYGTVESIDEGKLLAEATSSVFNLPTGTKRITAAEITPIDLAKHTDLVERTIEKIGTLPDGEYRICVYALSAGTKEVLGSTCQDASVLTLTQPELLSPLDKEIVRDIFPSFNWLPAVPAPHGSEVTYDLLVVEILERQTPEYALLSNPIWFVQNGIRTNLFRYPLGARPLTDSMRYAWQLKTYVDGILLSESEIREFSYENININIWERNKEIKEQIDIELKPPETNIERSFDIKDDSFFDSGFADNFPDKLPSGFSARSQYSSLNNKILFPDFPVLYPPLISKSYPEEHKAFEFLGSYSTEYQYSNMQGIGSEIPKNYLNLRFDPTLVVYGIPFSFSLFYSTQQQGALQNINSLALLLDLNYLKKVGEEEAREKITELENDLKSKKTDMEKQRKNLSPEEIEKFDNEIKNTIDEIESLKNNPERHLPGSQGFFSIFNTLGIGTNYPKYTSYTLDGARVTGLNLEMNPAWLYFAFAGWKNLDAVPNSTYARNLLAGRIGAGAKGESHFHITVMKAEDDINSLSVNEIPLSLTPQENLVFGTDASLNLFDNIFAIGGEVDASVFTRDVNSPELESDDIPGFVSNFTTTTMSSQLDYSYEIFSALDIKDTDTKLKGSYKMVGPGYTSLGAPGIRRDVEGFSVKLNQILFNRIVSFSASLAREQNNLISQSISTSTYYKYAFNLKMSFPNAPYLVIDYRPNFVSNDLKADTLKRENTAHVFSLMTGLNVIEEYLVSSTNFVISVQSSSSNTGDNDLTLFNFTVSENVSFNFPLLLTGSLGFIKTSPVDLTTVILDLSTGYIFFEMWRNSVGINYARESDRSKSTGIYFNSGIPVWGFGNLNLSLQQNFYRENVLIYGDRDELIFRAGISKRI